MLSGPVTHYGTLRTIAIQYARAMNGAASGRHVRDREGTAVARLHTIADRKAKP